MGFTFPKSNRLLKSYQYRKVSKRGKRSSGSLILVETLALYPSSEAKLGLTVSRKYGKSNLRNRFKRCVRESFRHLLPQLQLGLQINVAPRGKAREISSAVIGQELRSLLAPYLVEANPRHIS